MLCMWSLRNNYSSITVAALKIQNRPVARTNIWNVPQNIISKLFTLPQPTQIQHGSEINDEMSSYMMIEPFSNQILDSDPLN